MKYSLALLTLLFGLSFSRAQTNEFSSKIQAPIIEQIHSNIIGEDYNLHITLPPNYSSENNSYPVLYYLDGWLGTDIMSSAAYYQMILKHIDPIILVGISHETDLNGWAVQRHRDLKPPLSVSDSINRADNFLNFIKTEIIPHIENKYATNPKDRGLIGYSLGGLFSAWVLKKEPKLFHKLGITSPSLWYDEGFLLKDEKFINNIRTATNLEVFISYGSLEGDEFLAYGTKLYESLKTNKSIRVTKVIFENENHSTAWVVAYNRSLTYFYENQYNVLQSKAEQMYENGNYLEAIENYLSAFEIHPEQIKKDDRYNLACFYSLAGDKENAFAQLKILTDANYDLYGGMINDTDFQSLHSDNRWIEMLDIIKKYKD